MYDATYIALIILSKSGLAKSLIKRKYMYSREQTIEKYNITKDVTIGTPEYENGRYVNKIYYKGEIIADITDSNIKKINVCLLTLVESQEKSYGINMPHKEYYLDVILKINDENKWRKYPLSLFTCKIDAYKFWKENIDPNAKLPSTNKEDYIRLFYLICKSIYKNKKK